MDEVQYKVRCYKLKDKIRDVEHEICMFTDEDVFYHDDDISTPLEEIMSQYLSFETELENFYEKFNTISHPDWEQEWEAKRRALKDKCNENERLIIVKVKELTVTNNARVKRLREMHAATNLTRPISSLDKTIDKSKVEKISIADIKKAVYSNVHLDKPKKDNTPANPKKKSLSKENSKDYKEVY